MTILICDDEPRFLKDLEAHINAYMARRGLDYTLITSTDPSEIMNGEESFDLALLDIQMPVSGIALAQELKRRNPGVALFFVTNYEEYQDDAMDLRAFRFFEKPFQPERLYAGLDKAMEYIDGAAIDLFLTHDGIQKRVLVDSILYLTRENRHTLLVAKDGSLQPRESFAELCARLPVGFFYLVHKSFFVNLHYVDSYSYSELTLTNGDRIPVAPRKQAAFHRFWFDYLRRR